MARQVMEGFKLPFSRPMRDRACVCGTGGLKIAESDNSGVCHRRNKQYFVLEVTQADIDDFKTMRIADY